MKRLSVRYRKDARADLLAIYLWVYETSLDPHVARRFVERIQAACAKIGDAPSGGRPRDDLRPGLRTWPFERRGVIAYRVERDVVEIVNVFYGGRDYETFYRSAREP